MRRTSDLAAVNVEAIICKSGITIRQNSMIRLKKTIILKGFLTTFRIWFFSRSRVMGYLIFPRDTRTRLSCPSGLGRFVAK